MKQVSFAASLLLTGVVLAGCVGDSQPSAPERLARTVVLAAPAHTLGPSEAAPEGGPGRGLGPARAVPVKAWYDDGGAGIGLMAGKPFVTGLVNFTGTVKGDAAWVGKIYPPTSDHLLDFAKDPMDFTGSIPGCGSGSMTMIGHGFFRLDARGLNTNLTLKLVPGTQSVGLAGIVAVHMTMDTYEWPAKVPVTGTIWCR
ncbi:MAG TPA: hypothetical protein VI818_05930 [Candidatus Thermoplasmatota archaeon]|nr:hypothetical protein [Candidatus Thermoplasmatota archaeon]